jgi:hypothetical protein
MIKRREAGHRNVVNPSVTPLVGESDHARREREAREHDARVAREHAEAVAKAEAEKIRR